MEQLDYNINETGWFVRAADAVRGKFLIYEQNCSFRVPGEWQRVGFLLLSVAVQ